jgi:hypothetical protein
MQTHSPFLPPKPHMQPHLNPVFTTLNQLSDSEIAHFTVIFKHYLPRASGYAKLKLIIQPADVLTVHVHSIETRELPSPTWTTSPETGPYVDVDQTTPIDVVYATLSIPTKTAHFRMSVLVRHAIGFNGIDPEIDILLRAYKCCKAFKNHPHSLNFVQNRIKKQKPVVIHGQP